MSLSPQRVDFEKIWERLSEGVGKIVTMTGVKGMPMIEDVYRLCTAQPQPYSEELYLKLKHFLEQHVDSLAQALLNCQGDFLHDYLKKWSAYSVGTEYIHSIFRYLNNYWIKKRLEDSRNKLGSLYQHTNQSTTEVFEVYTLALVIWRDRLFHQVKDRIIHALLELIQKDRDGEQVNNTELYGVIQSYGWLSSNISHFEVKLGSINKSKPLDLYKEFFEAPFLSNTKNFYARESADYIAAQGVSAYMKKAEARLEEEQARAKKLLDGSSFDKVKRECESVLIDAHKDILQIECENYLRDEKIEDLSRMYRLLSRIGEQGIKPMLEVLQKYVTQTGLEAVKSIQKDASDPKKYIETLLNIYEQFSGVVRKAFSNDAAFVAALDKACRKVVNENVINTNGSKSPELLAKYCDVLLKKSAKAQVEDNKLEDKLTQIITIFKYIDDKDVFQKFYSKMLARRLIHGTSVSDDAESAMIGGLKQACGFEYTSKLQRMFTDMTLSGDINEKFKEYLTTNKVDLDKVDFNILVLTSGSWPLQTQSSSFNLPAELEKCVNHFQKYYNGQHHGRKLSWLHHLSKGDMRTLFLKKKYEFQVTNYQMAVLLQFNQMEVITIEMLANLTNLKESELKRTLESLIDAKLLLASPEGTDFAASHQFQLNKGYTNKRLKLKLTGKLLKETKAENEETHKGVEEDRKLYLQAAIVRIMKARKVLTHVNLVQEVITQAKTRFQPQIGMIKKCIETLIEKEYLTRIEGQTDTYQYCA